MDSPSNEPKLVSLANEPAPPRKGWNKLAWAVIILVVGGVIAVRFLPVAEGEEKSKKGQNLATKLMEVNAKLLVGMRHWAGGGNADAQEQLEAAKKFDVGPVAQRLRAIVLIGELAGPDEALGHVFLLEQDIQAGTVEAEPEEDLALSILKSLYNDHAVGLLNHPSVDEHEATILAGQLGWFADLALHPRGAEAVAPDPAVESEARQAVLSQAGVTLLTLAGAVVLALLTLAAGLCGLALFVFLWLGGQVSVGLTRGIPYAGVYTETFALWIGCYLVLSVVAAFTLRDVPFLARGITAMLLSLGVLAWPVLRGVPWRQVREDIGWTLGRQPLLEPFYGVFCYVINSPLAALGFALTFVLLVVQALVTRGINPGEPDPSAQGPSHPVLEFLSQGDWVSRAQLFFLLSVVAPLVEETMFRGVLHRAVRETAPLASALSSGLFSAFVVNFVFAAVHPQGLATIPVLMCLAFGFTLAREWRGTLIPGMVAHGLNNALVATLGILLLS